MTHADKLSWLAEQPGQCSGCQGFGFRSGTVGITPVTETCTECNGTGKAVRFPALRQRCPNWTLRHTLEGKIYSCGVCKGRGWVPVDSLEATWQACLEFGIHHMEIDLENNKMFVLLTPTGKSSDEVELDINWKGRASGALTRPNEVLVAALYGAVKGEEVKP